MDVDELLDHLAQFLRVLGWDLRVVALEYFFEKTVHV